MNDTLFSNKSFIAGLLKKARAMNMDYPKLTSSALTKESGWGGRLLAGGAKQLGFGVPNFLTNNWGLDNAQWSKDRVDDGAWSRFWKPVVRDTLGSAADGAALGAVGVGGLGTAVGPEGTAVGGIAGAGAGGVAGAGTGLVWGLGHGIWNAFTGNSVQHGVLPGQKVTPPNMPQVSTNNTPKVPAYHDPIKYKPLNQPTMPNPRQGYAGVTQGQMGTPSTVPKPAAAPKMPTAPKAPAAPKVT